jgi:hypothetical protein
MPDRHPNSHVALPESDRLDADPAAGSPDYGPRGGQDGERQARLVRAIEAQIVPRLLISLGTAHRRISRTGVTAQPNAVDLAEFARLLAIADQETDPSCLLPNSL